MDTLTLAIVAALVVVLILAMMYVSRRQTSKNIREQFGEEYDHTVEQTGNKRQAEKELVERAKRVKQFDIRELEPAAHDRFAEAWRNTQAHFVDAPAQAVTEADRLVNEVMQARGYPMSDFEQRAADISVNYAGVVTNYRLAHEIAERNRTGKASTEDLRQAMIYYRSLFNELLDETERSVEREKEMAR